MEGRSAITINASPDEVYARFRQLERLPEFMYHLKSVQVTGEGRSHWVAKGPAGTTVEWDADVVDDVPGKRIAWQSVDDSSVESSGSVVFLPAPGAQGTEVRVVVPYQPPGGALGTLGKVVATLFGEEPNQQLADDLRRLKQLIETGEIARSEGSPSGTRTINQADQRDAHPQEAKA